VWGIPFHKTHRNTWSADWPPSSWSVSSNWHHTLCLLITRVFRHERKSPKHKKSMYCIWDWDCTVTQATARKSTYTKARTNSDHENQTPRMRITIFADNSCFLRAFRLPLNQTHSECQSSKNNCILNNLLSDDMPWTSKPSVKWNQFLNILPHQRWASTDKGKKT
jgi:hypothetical protein